MGETGQKRINCVHCIHYAVTWNPKFPNGCSFFGFKTSKMPSLTVFESTGVNCPEFVRKKQVKR
jgi:hypothetical protein